MSQKYNEESTQEITMPTGRLAAVTRKKNEISDLLKNKNPDTDKIKHFFEEYKEKVLNFNEASLPFLSRDTVPANDNHLQFNAWYNDHSKEMEKFGTYMDSWVTSQEMHAEDSASQIKTIKTRAGSNRSSVSSSSSMKQKLAEKRAQRITNQTMLEEERKLEDLQEQQRQEAEQQRQEAEQQRQLEEQRREQQRQLEEQRRKQLEVEQKRQKEDLKMKRALIEEQNIQEEIDNMEHERSQRGSKASKFKGDVLNLKKLQVGVVQNPYFDGINTKLAAQNVRTEHDSTIESDHKRGSFQSKQNNNSLTEVLMKQNEISAMFLNSQERSNLPKHIPMSFDGTDITEYTAFMQTFERIIEARCPDDVDRLYYLEKFTSGLPLQLVKGCRNHDSTLAYFEAKRVLKREFGDESRISAAYIERMNNWKLIKSEDGRAIQEMSIYLFSCHNMMKDVSPLNLLNNPSEILKIIEKLPYKMKDAWRRFTLSLREQNRIVSFLDLCKFVQRQSDLINQPLFGHISDSREPRKDDIQKKTYSGNRRKAFTTTVTKNDQPQLANICVVCKKNNHQIKTCFFFRDKTHEDKIKFLKEKKMCFGCLSTGHLYRECRKRSKCDICAEFHPTVLHKKKITKSETPEEVSKPSGKKESTSEDLSDSPKLACATISESSGIQTGAGKRIVCPSIPVKIRAQGSHKMVVTYMGLDPYCTEVFMNQELLIDLGLKGRDCTINLTTMQGKCAATTTKVINNLEIYDLDENERSLIPVVYCKSKDWPFNKDDAPRPNDLEGLPFISDLPFKFVDASIGLLVGLNQPELTMPLKIIHGPNKGGPYATLHKHGYALNGPVGLASENYSRCFRTKIEHYREVDEIYKKHCSREFQDDDPVSLGPSIDDVKWEAKVRASFMKKEDGHFEVELPFRDDNIIFPQNKDQVLNRLMSSKKRLTENKVFYTEYKEFMDSMFENGFAEEVPIKELMTLPGKSWYLVHFGIFHKQKNKIRIVFDASLKYKGVSLNDMLLQGPDLTSSLLGVLLRFREDRIAFMADIQKMFYQVKVPIHQRNYLRFFWFPDGDLTQSPKEYRVTVHIFGAVSSPSIANFTLRELTKLNESNDFNEDIKKTILRNFYVDDLVKSAPDNKEAERILKGVCRLVTYGGFKLTAFVSNSRTLLRAMPVEGLSKDLKTLDLMNDDLPQERALGINWNIEDDTIGFNLRLPQNKNTRRGVLSIVFSVYDPFGLAGPVILPSKRIFQQTCYDGLQWDDPLPLELRDRWERWLQSVHLLSDYKLPRCFKLNNDVVDTQLHVFCDGSEIAYAAVAYLRIMDKERHVHCSLVMSKTRLVPLRGSALATIPRIELNGAKLAAQLYKILENELDLPIDKSVFWTDSTTVLRYINCESRGFQRFVCNRVTYIRAHTKVKDWKHVPGKMNPADLASRGASAKTFIDDEQWKYGPKFLQKPECEWPILQIDANLSEDDPELKKEKLVVNTKVEKIEVVDQLLHSVSNWYKVLKRVAMFLRLKQCLQKKAWQKGDLRIDELRSAEKAIWKYIQEKEYSSEMEYLKNNKTLSRKNKLTKLNPFMDEAGFLRVGGRISRAKTSYDVKHPLILPKNHHVVQLLARSIHVQVGHLGREVILAELRKKYWIVGANMLARKIANNCIHCRKYQAKPLQQIMGDLPEDRMAVDMPPFSHIGLDCFGPFMVTRGRAKVKRYGVIFTCLTCRAVHIEIVYSLESDSFICALRRFVARRGVPKLIRSDNGTNFVGAEKELRNSIEIFNTKRMKDWLLQNAIEWKFQPPAASHFGGVWEREIRTIRKVFGALLSEQRMSLHDEDLSTLMCEVESILNTRPLTAVSNDPNDFEALTPNHLLLARSGVTFPPGLFSKDDLYANRRWRQVQYLAELFWLRWRREYLPLLQQRMIWSAERVSCAVDDLVLVVDQLLPRNQWSLGRVTKIYPDDQGRVRVADVNIAKVKGELRPGNRTVTIRRPITKLISLRSNNQS